MTIKKKTITRLKEYNQRQYLKSILRNHHELTVNVRIFINKASLEFGLLNKKKQSGKRYQTDMQTQRLKNRLTTQWLEN